MFQISNLTSFNPKSIQFSTEKYPHTGSGWFTKVGWCTGEQGS